MNTLVKRKGTQYTDHARESEIKDISANRFRVRGAAELAAKKKKNRTERPLVCFSWPLY